MYVCLFVCVYACACMYICIFTYVSTYGTICPPMTCMASRSAFRSGLVVVVVVFLSVLSLCGVHCFALVAWALSWKLEILLSLFLVVAGFGRFFLYPGPGGLQNRSLKYGFCCFFVSFLFALCRFGRFGGSGLVCANWFLLFLRYSKFLVLWMKFFSVCLVFAPLRCFCVFFLCFWGLCLGAGFLRFLVFFDFSFAGYRKTAMVFNICFSVPLLFLFFCVFGACWATRFFAILGCSLAVRFADIAKQIAFCIHGQIFQQAAIWPEIAPTHRRQSVTIRIVTRHAPDRDIFVPVVFRICGFCRPLRFLAGRAPA